MTLLLIAAGFLIAGAFLTFLPRRHPAVMAIASQAIASALTVYAILPVLLRGEVWDATWVLGFPLDVVDTHADALSAFFLVWSLPLTLLGTIYAAGYLKLSIAHGRHGAQHFALLNVVSLSFLIIYTAQNALVFLLGWELAAIAAWLLVIWEYRNQKVRFAGFNYLVSTHVGLFALVAALMFLHGQTGSMDLRSFSAFLAVPSSGRNIVFCLLALSFALKSAFFPVHSWLPRAHAAAPAHVSALMSGVIHKAGLYAFLRFTLLLGVPEEWMGWAVLAFGTASAVFGAVYAASQHDLKRLIGYSSTENVGIAAMGFGLAYLGMAWHTPALVAIGIAGGALHLVNHAATKCLLFYTAGAVHTATHCVDLRRLGGLLRSLPATGALMLGGVLAISGLPPLNGFVSEFVLYAGLFGGGGHSALANVALVATGALLAFVAAVGTFAMLRAFGLAFLGSPRDPSLHVGPEVGGTMLLPMTLHGVAIGALGLMPVAVLGSMGPLLALFGAAGSLGVVTSAVAPVQLGSRVLVVLLATLCAGGWFFGRNARRHVTWGCGYPSGTSRMQYTGSSFSEQLIRMLATLLPQHSRIKLSRRIFPRGPGHVELHVPDAVEGRIFEVLGRGEDLFVRTAAAVPEEPRFAFAAGLGVVLVLIAALLARAS